MKHFLIQICCLLFISNSFGQSNITQLGSPLGSILSNKSGSIDIKIHPISDEPYAVYIDQNYCKLARFDGADWRSVGNHVDTAIGTNFELEFHPLTNEPYVKYSYNDFPTFEYVIQVSKFDGNQWVKVGTTDLQETNNIFAEYHSEMAFHPVTGELYVAHIDNGLKVAKLSNNIWSLLPPIPNANQNKVAFDFDFNPSNDRPMIAINQGNLFVMEFDGTNWNQIGDTVNYNPALNSMLEMEINPNTNDIYIQYFGGFWQELNTYQLIGNQWIDIDSTAQSHIMGGTPRTTFSSQNNKLYSIIPIPLNPEVYRLYELDGSQWNLLADSIGLPSFPDLHTSKQAGIAIIPGDTLPIVYVQNKDSSYFQAFILGNHPSKVNVNITSGDSLVADQSQGQFQWLDCDNNYMPISGETNRVFVPDQSGNYAVEFSNYIFKDTSDCVAFTKVSINENQNLDNIVQAYPNPTNDYLNIVLNTLNDTDLELNIYDSQGNLIRSSIIVSQDKTVDISQLKPGIYIYQLNSKYQTLRGKFIKE